ncbi:DoxX family protein [Aureimonas altamirensis]|uniref:DoxX family protein n=1 Tax=Aureimonas altamirensis TaxID=370622 RepID=UPI0020366B52|nr:DoxX family protein [Aureimonas altamirensis]MCM2505798.1 DoxX family protein [Aureimonas altamirensis]
MLAAVLGWIIAVFFIANGLVNLYGPESLRTAFFRWGFPRWFHITNGSIQILIGVMILMPATRIIGFGFGVLLSLAILIVLFRQGEMRHALPCLTLLASLLVAAWEQSLR